MPRQRLKVLMVDDHLDTLELYSVALDDSRFQLLLASDGEQAVAVAEREEPDVVVMDLRLPGISGIEALGQMRRNGRSLAAIALTGDATHATDALAGGFDLFCVKPCSPDELTQKILCLAHSTPASIQSEPSEGS